jgi:two-component SAPR family response regulator
VSTRQVATRRAEDEDGWLGFVGLVSMCIAVGVGLWWLVGPPTMFTSEPDWAYVREVLGSSEVRDRDVITVAAGAAWIVIGYVLLSVGIRLLFGAAFAITGGAAWARAALRVTTPLTIPVVRRVVDATLAGTIVVSATLQTPSLVSATGASTASVVEMRGPAASSAADPSATANAGSTVAPALQVGPHTYTVLRGDHLWGIAERYLGDGFRWTDIWRLNREQPMVDGRRFVDPNLIYPGWVLELPDDAVAQPETIPDVPDTEPDDELDVSPTPTSTVDLEPTPSPSTPGPTPALPTATPVMAPGAGTSAGPGDAVDGDGDVRRPTFPDLPMAGAGMAAVAALGASGAVVFLVVRRFRSRASAAGERRRRGRQGDAGRVLAMTAALTSGLEELEFGESQILLARETEHYVEFTVRCPHGDEDALVAARHELGRVLGCAFNGAVIGPGVVHLKLSRMSHLATAIFADYREHHSLLLPVGAADDGIYYLCLSAVGSILATGDRLETRELGTSWLTTLQTLYEDTDLTVVADDSAQEHLGEVLGGVLDGGETRGPVHSLGSFVQHLEQELVARDPEASQDAVLAVVGPAEDGAAMAKELDGVLRQGPPLAVFTIVLADEADTGAAARRAFGAVISASTDDEGPAMTLTLSGVGALQLEPVVLRRLTAFRPAPSSRELDDEPSEEWFSVDSAHPVPVVHDESDEEELEQVDIWAIGDEVEPEPAAVASTNGAHALVHTPVSAGRVRAEDAMDRQASLPFEAADEEVWEGPRFRVKLFGAFRIATDDDEIATWAIHKSRELLAYLLVHGGSPVLRDTVSETLWPETNRKQAYHQLSNAAYTLRRTIAQALGNLEAQSLVILNQRYQLRPGLFRVDIDTFDAHLSRADSLQGHDALVEYERACRLYTAPLLIHEAWDWAGPYREDYRSRFVAAMKRAGALALTLRDPKLAVDFYNRILQQEPIDEEAVQGLLRCYSAVGDVTGAKVAYRRLVEALQETLDDDTVEPLPQTVAAYREVLGRDGD